MTPYYDEDGITIYHGDCREWTGTSDAVVTDPPYPDYWTVEYGYDPTLIDVLKVWDCLQFVFWSAKATFPLDYSAVHVWDKKVGAASQYERIFERNGGSAYRMYRHYLINSTVAAQFGHDTFTGHPSQKPIRLMRELVSATVGTVLDPFMGAGSTLAAAKQLGRRAIGIEIEEKYCEIAVQRLAQGVLQFGVGSGTQ